MNLYLNNIDKKYSFEEYVDLHSIQIKEKSQINETKVNKELIKLNLQRIKRVLKQFIPNEKLKQQINLLQSKYNWLIISEPWCGDSAQIIPVLYKIAEITPEIEIKIILRDSYPEIMNKFLTNGSRSIPKLIIIDTVDTKVVKTWGPRPEKLTKMINEFKLLKPGFTKDELQFHLHKWYAEDKGNSVANDLIEIFININRKKITF